MVIDRGELKRSAKKQIKGNVATCFGLTIVISLIIGVSCFTFVGPLLLEGAFSLGLAMFALEIVRSEKADFNTGFKGFSQFGASLAAALLMSIFICLWSLLLVIPGIIAVLRYSMTYFILADNPGMSGPDAIKKSKEIMQGHKGDLFVLLFSFFWWYVLCAVTFGLAGIYVCPYVSASVANFYEKIKSEPNGQEEPVTNN